MFNLHYDLDLEPSKLHLFTGYFNLWWSTTNVSWLQMNNWFRRYSQNDHIFWLYNLSTCDLDLEDSNPFFFFHTWFLHHHSKYGWVIQKISSGQSLDTQTEIPQYTCPPPILLLGYNDVGAEYWWFHRSFLCKSKSGRCQIITDPILRWWANCGSTSHTFYDLAIIPAE